MSGVVRSIKRLFGVYECGHEYWINRKDIKVPTRYKKSKVGYKKWSHKIGYWLRTGEFKSPILLHRDFTLADGYTSVKIAYLNGIEKVPVYFID